MGIFHQLERVAEDTSVMEKQPRLTAVFPSPARAPPRGLQFETPSASVRPNDSASASASDTLSTPATETSAPVGVSAQGGASFSAPVVRPTPTTQNTTQMSEWLKVLLSFFFLKNTSEFSAPMTNYLDKYILEKTSEQNSVLLLTESLHYSQLRTFLQLTDDKSKKKAVQVSVHRIDHSSANEPNCGQRKCIEKGRFHPAERCWTLHPERMPQRLQPHLAQFRLRRQTR